MGLLVEGGRLGEEESSERGPSGGGEEGFHVVENGVRKANGLELDDGVAVNSNLNEEGSRLAGYWGGHLDGFLVGSKRALLALVASYIQVDAP